MRAPLFVKGPTTFLSAWQSQTQRFDIVVHGDASGVKTEGFDHRHHRFFVKRLLEERA